LVICTPLIILIKLENVIIKLIKIYVPTLIKPR
jgi:hypothetical protein